MLKDELITKKEMERKFEEDFNKDWYNELKEDTFYIVKELLTSDNEYIVSVDSIALDCQTYENPFLAFKMFRSKLWNEGINLLISIDGGVCAKVRKNEKYNDNCVIYDTSEKIEEAIIVGEVSGDYSMLENIMKNSVEKTSKPLNSKNIKKNSKPKSKKKRMPEDITKDNIVVVNNVVNNSKDDEIPVDTTVMDVVNTFGNDDSE